MSGESLGPMDILGEFYVPSNDMDGTLEVLCKKKDFKVSGEKGNQVRGEKMG